MRGISFLNPWLLAGLGAVAIPIIIHLINRRRAFLYPFAAIDFLLRSQRRIAARFHLKQLLLLLVRCAAVAGLAVALARPLLSRVGVAPVAIHEPTSLVVIVDNSYSMQYVLGGQPLFEHARAAARTLLRSLHTSDNAALFFGPAPAPSSSAGLTSDVASLLRDVDGTKCSFGTTDVPAWVKSAEAVLRESKLPRKRLCILTDGARHGWPRERAEGLAARLKAAGIQGDLLDVSGGARLDNLAVVGLETTKVGGDVSVAIARIANHTKSNASGLACAVSIDGKKIGTGFVDARAGATVTKEFACGSVPPGYHVCEMKIESGGRERLSVDDRRLISLMTGKPINVLLVDGAPGPHIYASETFYLERALSPDAAGGGPLRTTVVTEGQLAGLKLEGFDCVFLCNVGTLPAETIRDLAAFIERGGGLFISAGDNVDVNYYNRYWSGFLPQPLRDKKEISAPGAAPGVSLRMAGDVKDPLVAALSSEGLDLARVSVRKAVLLEASPGSSASRILSLSNDLPALVERRVGAGRVLFLATSVDREWTNLPITTAFLPLMQLCARYLAGRMEEDPRLDTLVGRPVEFALPADCKRVRITDPNGAVQEFDAAALRPPRRFKFVDTATPGAYEIAFLGMPRGDERRGFVVNLDAEMESNLQKVSRKEMERFGLRMVGVREDEEVSMNYLEFGAEHGLWPPFLAGLLFLLIAECLLARKP